MNTYILVYQRRKEEPDFSKCQAPTLESAIADGFKFFPWTLGDFAHLLGDPDDVLERFEETKKGLQVVALSQTVGVFTNGSPIGILAERTIYILEIKPDGTVKVYPPGAEVPVCDHDPEEW